ncbi:hypothetical protein BN871_EG_00120 [Paenibacillus sp. P22]|nr:hypothetical protein BN871_EG_00120 [Paenibacillus sp. P22]
MIRMLKAMVVRAGSGWGKALVKQLIGANVEVVAYSGSQRKLDALEEAFSSTSLLRTARGEAGNRSKLLAAAEGVDVIFCGVYLTYDDKPEKVRRMLEAVRSAAAATGARTVTLEGVYLPADEEEPMHPNLPGATSMRIFSRSCTARPSPTRSSTTRFAKSFKGDRSIRQKRLPLRGRCREVCRGISVDGVLLRGRLASAWQRSNHTNGAS